MHNLGNPTVDKVTPRMIEGWFASVMKPHTDRIGIGREPVAASTANYYRTRIQSLQRYCTQRGWTTTDWLAHSPRMRQAKRTRQQPAVDLLLAMLDATTDPRNRAVLAVAMNTGLRSSEIGHLRVGDVDLNTLTLQTWINKSLLEDEMPMTSDLAGELRTWMRTYAKRIGRPLIPADHLLPAYAGPRIGYRKDENGALVKYMRESVIVPHRPAVKLHRIAQEALRAVGQDTKGEGIHTLRRATFRAFYDSLKAQGHEAAIR